jgi:signal transduction histidine kinase
VRNPLNNITLSAEQLQQDGLVNEAGDLYLNIIQRNAMRISGLINELLNTSKPSEVVPEERILQSILDDVVAASIDRITLKKIKLDVQYPNEPVQIMADAEKLKLALLNIVINAIEAMEEGSGRLVISLQVLRQTAMLRIADNGCGISEENISRLFEPYFTQKRNGMGLGLAFTLNILQAHKATIDVSSGEQMGTTFTINFPLSLFFDENNFDSIEDGELQAHVIEPDNSQLS